MAGKMTAHKGMRAARMKEKPKPPSAPPTPHKNPRSAHLREANGGYIMSAHGGDGDGMGTDHVAPDLESMIARLKSHMGGAEEATGDMPMESASDEMAETGQSKPAPSPKKASKKKPKVKLRDKSETY